MRPLAGAPDKAAAAAFDADGLCWLAPNLQTRIKAVKAAEPSDRRLNAPIFNGPRCAEHDTLLDSKHCTMRQIQALGSRSSGCALCVWQRICTSSLRAHAFASGPKKTGMPIEIDENEAGKEAARKNSQ
jgi:hypothetical protein